MAVEWLFFLARFKCLKAFNRLRMDAARNGIRLSCMVRNCRYGVAAHSKSPLLRVKWIVAGNLDKGTFNTREMECIINCCTRKYGCLHGSQKMYF